MCTLTVIYFRCKISRVDTVRSILFKSLKLYTTFSHVLITRIFHNPVFCLLFHHDADSFTKFLSLGQLGQREKKKEQETQRQLSVREKN